MNPIQRTKPNSMHHRHLTDENPKITTKFGFHYSPLHLQCLKFLIYPDNIHIEQEKRLIAIFLILILIFFQSKIKCLVKPIEKNPIFDLVPGNGAKKLIARKYTGVVV